jgi:aspartate-semialdehyde dehydrogenase
MKIAVVGATGMVRSNVKSIGREKFSCDEFDNSVASKISKEIDFNGKSYSVVGMQPQWI